MGLRPIYLLADSQLLFWRDRDGALLLDSSKTGVEAESASASYLGASNGDDPAYYTIFEAAMEIVGVTRNFVLLVRVPDGVVTCTKPVRAPVGTIAVK